MTAGNLPDSFKMLKAWTRKIRNKMRTSLWLSRNEAMRSKGLDEEGTLKINTISLATMNVVPASEVEERVPFAEL